jgi:addiction module HigA family antidote
VLQEEFLSPLGLTQSALARHIGVRPFVICGLVHGKRSVTPRLALLLSRALGTTPELWLGLQADHDLTALRRTPEGRRVQSIPRIASAGR